MLYDLSLLLEAEQSNLVNEIQQFASYKFIHLKLFPRWFS